MKKKFGETMHKKNPYSEYHTCKHCGKRIGHRPYTRGWEHIGFSTCDKPFPVSGTCFCVGCHNE